MKLIHNHSHTVVALALAAALGAGCATEQQTQTAIGAGAGAATGAVLGTAIGGSGQGTAVGTVIGAGVGAAAGYNWPLVKEKLGIGDSDSEAKLAKDGNLKEQLGMATQNTEVKVSEQKDGSLKVNVPGTVSFASGSAMITPELFPTLDKIAATLNEHPNTTITVVGYTDSVGSMALNNELSLRRADAVVNYLNERGVHRSRMIVHGRGELDPIADNATEAGRAENRRVEMLIQPLRS